MSLLNSAIFQTPHTFRLSLRLCLEASNRLCSAVSPIKQIFLRVVNGGPCLVQPFNDERLYTTALHRQARSQTSSLLCIVLVLLFPFLFVSGPSLPFSICVTLLSLAANYFMFYNSETFLGLIIMTVTHHEELKVVLQSDVLSTVETTMEQTSVFFYPLIGERSPFPLFSLTYVHHHWWSMFREVDFFNCIFFFGPAACETLDEQVDLFLNSTEFASEREVCRVQVKIKRGREDVPLPPLSPPTDVP